MDRLAELETNFEALKVATGIAIGRLALHAHPDPQGLAQYFRTCGMGIKAATPEQDDEMIRAQRMLEEFAETLERYVENPTNEEA